VQEHFFEGEVRTVRYLDVDAFGFEELHRTPGGWPARRNHQAFDLTRGWYDIVSCRPFTGKHSTANPAPGIKISKTARFFNA
jgi:hypothetical protein